MCSLGNMCNRIYQENFILSNTHFLNQFTQNANFTLDLALSLSDFDDILFETHRNDEWISMQNAHSANSQSTHNKTIVMNVKRDEQK